MIAHRQYSRFMTITCLVAVLLFVCCTDEDIVKTTQKDKRLVHFTLADFEKEQISNAKTAVTRGFVNSDITQEDLAPQKLLVTNHSVGIDACLIETTVEGINPVTENIKTRAQVKFSIDADFTALGYHGKTSASISSKPEWFYNEKIKQDGAPRNPLRWSGEYPWGRCYGVYPEVSGYAKMALSPANYSGSPYIDFEVETDVKKQVDLMTACSGDIYFPDTQEEAPETMLEFRHALTAIKIAVGQNLSWNKQIDRIEIRNALSKGKYTLSDHLNGAGAAWDATTLSNRKTFSLDLSTSPISTSDNPNNVIVGKNGDNYTFYMIPQTLTGNNVEMYVHCTDNSFMLIPLKGTWKAGTTKKYKLSEANSTWQYVLNVESPGKMQQGAWSANYKIESYRQAPDGTKQPMAWKIVGYQISYYNGDSWEALTDNRPDWIYFLSVIAGTGGEAENGTANVNSYYSFPSVDQIPAYNKVLQEAKVKGSTGNYYNLSNAKGEAQIENTANSYLISAPGYYEIPLVYGNAIKNGSDNPSSYKTQHTGTRILSHFKDHMGTPISSPYINIQNASNPADNATLVWADHAGLVENLSVVNNGSNSFVRFHIPADKIVNGNAVIAVRDHSGTVMWSWHLWFDHADVLNTIVSKNAEGHTYHFTKRLLGAFYSIYSAGGNTVRAKVEQLTTGNGGKKQFGYINFSIENNNRRRQTITPFYQFGRKDPSPGYNTVPEGNFVAEQTEVVSIINQIQHPEKFYCAQHSYTPLMTYPVLSTNEVFSTNLWSMESTVGSVKDENVVKTIYDPCPVGFKVPPFNAFGGIHAPAYAVAIDGIDYYSTPTATETNMFIPFAGFRGLDGFAWNLPRYAAIYWTASPKSDNIYEGNVFWHDIYSASILYSRTLAGGNSVYPIKDD